MPYQVDQTDYDITDESFWKGNFFLIKCQQEAPHISHPRDQDINGLAQDCSNSIANALELLQSCTKLSI